MISLLFETFNVPSFSLANQGVLSLYSAGKTTGIVLEVGDGLTQIVPVRDGYSIKHATTKLEFAGKDITDLFAKEMHKIGYNFHGSNEKVARSIKEKLCYVPISYGAEMTKAKNTNEIFKTFDLPDGNVISFGRERFKFPEMPFNPKVCGREGEGIVNELYNSIKKCDEEMQKELFENIIVSGGTSMMKGFPERVENELNVIVPESTKVKVIVEEDRKYAAWVGGSILGSNSTFQDLIIEKEEFKEEGPEIVHRKCIF